MGGIKCPPIYTRIPREAGCGHIACWNYSADHPGHVGHHGHAGQAGTSTELKCQECGSVVNLLLQGASTDDSTLEKSFAQVLKKRNSEKVGDSWKCSSCSKPANQKDLLFCLKCHPFITREGAICVPCSVKSDHMRKHGVNGLINYGDAADEDFRSATLRKMYEKKAECLKKFAAALDLLRNNLAQEIGLSHFQNIRTAVFNHFQNPLKRDMERLLLESDVICDTVDEVCDAINELSEFGGFMQTNRLTQFLNKVNDKCCDEKNGWKTDDKFPQHAPAVVAPDAPDSAWEVCASIISTSHDQGPLLDKGSGTPRSSPDSGGRISCETSWSNCEMSTSIGSSFTTQLSESRPQAQPSLAAAQPFSKIGLSRIFKTQLSSPQLSSPQLSSPQISYAANVEDEEFPPLNSSAKPQQKRKLFTSINADGVKNSSEANSPNQQLNQQLSNICDFNGQKERRHGGKEEISPKLAQAQENGISRALSESSENSGNVSDRLKAAVKAALEQPNSTTNLLATSQPRSQSSTTANLPSTAGTQSSKTANLLSTTCLQSSATANSAETAQPQLQSQKKSYANVLPPFVWPRSSTANSLPNSPKFAHQNLQNPMEQPQKIGLVVDPDDPQPNAKNLNGWPHPNAENLRSPRFRNSQKIPFPTTEKPTETSPNNGAASFWSNRSWSLESS